MLPPAQGNLRRPAPLQTKQKFMIDCPDQAVMDLMKSLANKDKPQRIERAVEPKCFLRSMAVFV